jgi:hypothetical protein
MNTFYWTLLDGILTVELLIIMNFEFLVLNYFFLDTLVKSAALVFCEELNGAGRIGQIRTD